VQSFDERIADDHDAIGARCLVRAPGDVVEAQRVDDDDVVELPLRGAESRRDPGKQRVLEDGILDEDRGVEVLQGGGEARGDTEESLGDGDPERAAEDDEEEAPNEAGQRRGAAARLTIAQIC
jgi:hypothetical protein